MKCFGLLFFKLFIFSIYLLSQIEANHKIKTNLHNKILSKHNDINTVQPITPPIPIKTQAISTSTDLRQTNESVLQEENRANTYNDLYGIKGNISSIIAALSILTGFVIAMLFFIVAIVYNNKTIEEFSSASVQIVHSFKEVMDSKLNEEILTMKI